MKLIPAWASKREVELPGVFRTWRELWDCFTFVGFLWAVGALVLYLAAELLSAYPW